MNAAQEGSELQLIARSMDEWFVQLDRLPDFSPEQKDDLQEILNDPQRVKDPNALFSDPESAVRRLQKLLARTGQLPAQLYNRSRDLIEAHLCHLPSPKLPTNSQQQQGLPSSGASFLVLLNRHCKQSALFLT
ncbi:hypothetical protein WJX84_000153 [Apatococcus fuscideae]|uniref:Uncharacterized protein n=1 Tax=Apatococcus fuscideae TaxID=2026836 RepID=A0AAW1SDF6_9CHLO